MAAKPKQTSKRIISRARQVLAFARDKAGTAKDWIELSNAIFSPTGKATELFATEKERGAFLRTKECKEIRRIFDTLPTPPVKEEIFIDMQANGAPQVTVRPIP